MPLDLTTALNSYGFVGQLANAIPDLKGILAQAVKDEWVPEQFRRALMDSPWWKNNAESVRQLSQLWATDPATYRQNLHNAASKIRLIAGEMGRSLNFDTSKFALRAMQGNWDDEQIRATIANEIGLGANQGALTGDAAQLGTHLREVASAYGVAYTDASVNGQITRIQKGQDTLDGWEALMRARAKAQYAHLASQIDAGMTVRDIADPYIATYAQVLEVPETGVKLTDSAITKALLSRTPDGALASKPMHEFVRQLKDDPRWDQTQNAQEEAYRMVSRLGKDMGFLS